MREIEVLNYERIADESAKALSSPPIYSSWFYAKKLYVGKKVSGYNPESVKGSDWSYRLAWFFPHLFLPHLVSVFAGLILLHLSVRGYFGSMSW